MITIRPETLDDQVAIRDVIVAAFTHSQLGYQGEAELVDRLRVNCNGCVSLVATDGDEVVGHIFFSPVSIRSSAGSIQGMGLAPMSVAPKRQRTGIGAALIHAGLEQLAADGCRFVVVLGHPEYYAKFGFVPASQFGTSHGFGAMPQDVFFVNKLSLDVIQSIDQGVVHFRPEFGPQHSGTKSHG